MQRHPILDQSFNVIDREVGPHALSREEYEIARRVIHATADLDFVHLLEFRGDFVAAAGRALRDRCPVIVDSHMTLEGVRSTLSALQIVPRCFLREPAVRLREGQTRTEAAMRYALSCLSGALVVVGNSPTALLALCEELQAGRAHVCAVIGMPVGFVSVEESKLALRRLEVPSLLSRGRKGGSAAAAAVVNALVELSGGRSDG